MPTGERLNEVVDSKPGIQLNDAIGSFRGTSFITHAVPLYAYSKHEADMLPLESLPADYEARGTSVPGAGLEMSPELSSEAFYIEHADKRLGKLVQKEQELEYYKDLQQRLVGQTKKETKRFLDEDAFKDEAQLDKMIKDIEKSVRKVRNKDLGVTDNVKEEEAPAFSLLDIPDEQLNEAGLKQKRHQRLLKSGVGARARAKIEKDSVVSPPGMLTSGARGSGAAGTGPALDTSRQSEPTHQSPIDNYKNWRISDQWPPVPSLSLFDGGRVTNDGSSSLHRPWTPISGRSVPANFNSGHDGQGSVEPPSFQYVRNGQGGLQQIPYVPQGLQSTSLPATLLDDWGGERAKKLQQPSLKGR